VVITAILLLLLVSYLILFLFINHYVNSGQTNYVKQFQVDEPIAVVIAMRNEEDQILDCLHSLYQSAGLSRGLKVYLVDDQSTDASVIRVLSFIKENPHLNLELLNSNGIGKKRALIHALGRVSEPWCFLTDADCVVQPSTIKSLMQTAKREDKQVVYGPVSYDKGSFINSLMAYENLNNQLVGEALLEYGRPAMVNGANTLLSKSIIEDYIKAQKVEYASGDDVFFSQSLSRDEYAVSYNFESAVVTKSPESIVAFFYQRLRWASKYSGYSKLFYRLFPVLIFIQNFLFLIILSSWIISGLSVDGLLITLILKWIIEWSFHSFMFKKYNFKAGFYKSILISLLQPIHISLVGLFSLVNLSYKWKGRTVVNQSIVN